MNSLNSCFILWSPCKVPLKPNYMQVALPWYFLKIHAHSCNYAKCGKQDTVIKCDPICYFSDVIMALY